MKQCIVEPLHYEVEVLPHSIAIWRTSIDHTKVYSVMEITPQPPPDLDDQFAALLRAMAETND